MSPENASMKLKLIGLLLTLLIPLGLSSQALAGHHEKEEASDPLAAAAEFPLTMRRTTLIVRDIEASLKLYRDGLGMEVIYDEEINRPHSSEDREQRLRLILLKASHDYVGVIGFDRLRIWLSQSPRSHQACAARGIYTGQRGSTFQYRQPRGKVAHHRDCARRRNHQQTQTDRIPRLRWGGQNSGNGI